MSSASVSDRDMMATARIVGASIDADQSTCELESTLLDNLRRRIKDLEEEVAGVKEEL